MTPFHERIRILWLPALAAATYLWEIHVYPILIGSLNWICANVYSEAFGYFIPVVGLMIFMLWFYDKRFVR